MKFFVAARSRRKAMCGPQGFTRRADGVASPVILAAVTGRKGGFYVDRSGQ